MLTEEQMSIVHTQHRHCKVMAAAGSGKTTVLVARMHMLRVNGYDPSKMMAITFTRRAGKQLIEQLGPEFEKATIGTFHSVILAEMAKNGGGGLNPLSEEESEELINQCAGQLGIVTKGKWKGSRKSHIESLRKSRTGEAPQTQLSQLYTSRLRINGDIDFDGILIYGCEMAKQGKFSWVEFLFIDEAQDNEPLQWEFVNSIAQTSSVMAVGDIGQSMYAFRGAVPEQFQSQPWPTMAMSESFRFPKKIADLANAIGATPLQVVSNKDGGLVWTGEIPTDQLARRLLIDGAEPSDVAILCRYNAQVESIRAELIAAGIPVVIPSVRFRGQVHDLLMCLASPRSPTSRNRIRTWSGSKPRIVELLGSSMSNEAAMYLTASWAAGNNVGQIVSQLEGLDQFRSFEARDIINEYGGLSLGAYKIATSEPEWICEGQGVTVGTVHWAKGGEWPIVVLPGLDKGKWPRKLSDEELRVLYVALTRTQEQLFVTYSDPSEYVDFFRNDHAIYGMSSV